ncbi:hypothetical protein R3P38DRAFT_2768887 [Favolaschia claudopus]|uniref:Uncharacterized protein n=1 Tax=Favolaschia claudopus TaxID=2862362 RepID=A0AAW0CQS2_9AGAR
MASGKSSVHFFSNVGRVADFESSTVDTEDRHLLYMYINLDAKYGEELGVRCPQLFGAWRRINIIFSRHDGHETELFTKMLSFVKLSFRKLQQLEVVAIEVASCRGCRQTKVVAKCVNLEKLSTKTFCTVSRRIAKLPCQNFCVDASARQSRRAYGTYTVQKIKINNFTEFSQEKRQLTQINEHLWATSASDNSESDFDNILFGNFIQIQLKLHTTAR